MKSSVGLLFLSGCFSILVSSKNVWSAGGRQTTVGTLLHALGDSAALKCVRPNDRREAYLFRSGEDKKWTLGWARQNPNAAPQWIGFGELKGQAPSSSRIRSFEERRINNMALAEFQPMSAPVSCASQDRAALQRPGNSAELLTLEQAHLYLESSEQVEQCRITYGVPNRSPLAPAHLWVESPTEWQLYLEGARWSCEVQSLDLANDASLRLAWEQAKRWNSFRARFNEERAQKVALFSEFIQSLGAAEEELRDQSTAGSALPMADDTSRLGNRIIRIANLWRQLNSELLALASSALIPGAPPQPSP